MSKKNINEGIIDKAISSIFGAIGKGLRKQVLKDLAKKDPKIAKSIKDLEDARKNLKSVLSKKDTKLALQGKYFKPGAFD